MEPEETEFDPEQYPPEYVVVGVSELMPSVLERVEEAWTRTPNAVLIVPRGTIAFHSTHDFLALGKLQDSRFVRVSVGSHDPIIIGLARVLGFYVLDPPPAHPALAGDPIVGDAPPEDVEQPTAPLPLGRPDPTGPDWVFVPTLPQASSTTSTWLGASGDTPIYPGGQPASAGANPLHRPGMPPPRTRPRQTGQLLTSTITGADLGTGALPSMPPVSTTPTGSIKARRVIPQGTYQHGRLRYGGRLRPASWGKFVAFLVAALVVLVVAGSTYAYIYLPEGTVSLTPLNTVITDRPVEIIVVTGVTSGQESKDTSAPHTQDNSGGSQTAPSITADIIKSPLAEEGTRPASGSKQVPRGRGQGTMRFTNRTGNPVAVAAGTQFKASNGIIVQTTQGGTVAPTVFGQSFGTLDLPIAATVDGPDGNIAAGQIAGVLNGTLNYTNSALQGGGMDTVKVVRQEDIDGLVAELRQKAEGRAASTVVGMVGAGQQLITQTIAVTDAQFYPLDHKAGEDGDSVRVRFTANAQAYVYKENELRDSVRQAMLDSVQTTIPLTVGPNLDLGSVQYSPPIVTTTEAGRVTYRTSASGRVTYSLTPELASQIRALVKGKAVSQARNLILQNYSSYLNPDSIEAKVLWFSLDTLPSDPKRIAVEPSLKARP